MSLVSKIQVRQLPSRGRIYQPYPCTTNVSLDPALPTEQYGGCKGNKVTQTALLNCEDLTLHPPPGRFISGHAINVPVGSLIQCLDVLRSILL